MEVSPLTAETWPASESIAIEGTDDHDEMGVYVEPPEIVLGLLASPIRPRYVRRKSLFGRHYAALAEDELFGGEATTS